MRASELSPRALLGWLEPKLGLDELVVGEWRLFDAYRLDPGEPVGVELRRAGQRDTVRVEFEPERGDERHRPMARVAGLRLGYRSTSDGAAGVAACEALAAILEPLLGSEPRRWTVAPPSLETQAEAVEAEVEWRPSGFEGELDASLLARDFEHYERLYDVRPQVRRVRVAGVDVPGVSIHYPAPRKGRVPPSGAVYPTSLKVAHRRRMRRYFGRLGCVFEPNTEPRTVPTPTTYARALRGREGLARIRPRMIDGVSGSMQPIHWGVLVRRHVLPVTVSPTWSVGVHERIRDVGPLSRIPCDVGMLVHDMGLHAFALHAVPEAAWDELAALAFERVRANPLRVLGGRWGILAGLAAFFEGPVTSHCWDAWEQAQEPEDFAEAFEPHFRELRAQLRDL